MYVHGLQAELFSCCWRKLYRKKPGYGLCVRMRFSAMLDGTFLLTGKLLRQKDRCWVFAYDGARFNPKPKLRRLHPDACNDGWPDIVAKAYAPELANLPLTGHASAAAAKKALTEAFTALQALFDISRGADV